MICAYRYITHQTQFVQCVRVRVEDTLAYLQHALFLSLCGVVSMRVVTIYIQLISISINITMKLEKSINIGVAANTNRQTSTST